MTQKWLEYLLDHFYMSGFQHVKYYNNIIINISCYSPGSWLKKCMTFIVCVSQLRLRAVRVSLLVVCISTERISSPAVSTSAAVWMVWWVVCRCVHTTSLCPADTAPTRVWRRRRDAAVRSGCVTMITASGKTHRTPVPITPHPTTSANSYRALTASCHGGAPFKVFFFYIWYIIYCYFSIYYCCY